MPSEKSKNKRLRIVTGAADGDAPAPDERPETEVSPIVQDPNCQYCFGTGMEVVPEVGARRCRCQTLDQRQRLFHAARIPPRYQHCTLQDYKHADSDSDTSKWLAKAEAQRILDDYLVIEGRGLVFFGAGGGGETHPGGAL